MTVAVESARWDLTPYFPTFQGPEYQQFFEDIRRDLAALLTSKEDWASRFLAAEKLGARMAHLSSYLGCKMAEDTTVEAVRQEMARLATLEAELEKVGVMLEAHLKALNDEAFEALAGHPELASARFALERMRLKAQHTMDQELETLAADLAVDGFHAWGRLYDTVAGGLEFDLQMPDGTVRKTPFSWKNSLLEDPDARVRKATLVGSNEAWQRFENVAAACLNAIAGNRLTLYRRRGVKHFLDVALEDACLGRRSLDTMMEVLASRKEVVRGYLREKARVVGLPRLGIQDIYCPMPVSADSQIPWSEARQRILDAFGSFYPRLRDYAAHAFERNWIDTEPRAGRAPGGFCTGSPTINETRIFMTYNQTLGDVMTLAHELGHGYHEWMVRDLRPWQRSYPMTLAETASTFAEAIYTESLLRDPSLSVEQQAVIVDRRLHEAAAYLLNIPVRFDFEKKFYEERAEGEVSVSRLKELMLEAERDWYGDALASDELDPYFWASKLHFYITEVSFYNFPYSFGYLFSSSVFERARAEGPDFLARYEELLRLTGSDTCEGVARRSLGVDLEKPDFWLKAVEGAERDVARFRQLVQEEPFSSRTQRPSA